MRVMRLGGTERADVSGDVGAAGVRPPVLATARGQLEHFVIEASGTEASGWIFHPAHPIDEVRVVVDGKPVGTAAVSDRADIRSMIAGPPHAAHSGFQVHTPRRAEDRAIHKVGVIGCSGGKEVIALSAYRLGALHSRAGAPPSVLMMRVSGNDDVEVFLQTGLRIAGNMIDCIDRHWRGARPPRLLDWGCGCGRMTQFIPELIPGVELTGCDLDAEAIGWMRERMPDSAFEVTGPFPPLPFADGSFDVVTACSVMTHLKWEVQRQWLAEIRRVLAPGGLFVATVHGERAVAVYRAGLEALLRAMPVGYIKFLNLMKGVDLWLSLQWHGIWDSGGDQKFDGVAPENYYRGIFQSKRFTYRKWGRAMPIIDYLDAGLDNFQDLVVMRRESRTMPAE